MKFLALKFLIVGLFCIVALQGCVAAQGTTIAAAPQPIITMTPGSWR
jgi:hypothetical protein